jgi:hypothetical protein
MTGRVLLALLALACTTSAAPCAPAQQNLVVTTAGDAVALTTAALCQGGTITVVWQGKVKLAAPIVVGQGTTLTINGAGEAATVAGGKRTSMFTVLAGAVLELRDLTVLNGW